MNAKDRIKSFFVYRVKPKDFIEKTRKKDQHYRQLIKSGNPTAETLQMLCEKFNISANWLLLGIGPERLSECGKQQPDIDLEKAVKRIAGQPSPLEIRVIDARSDKSEDLRPAPSFPIDPKVVEVLRSAGHFRMAEPPPVKVETRVVRYAPHGVLGDIDEWIKTRNDGLNYGEIVKGLVAREYPEFAEWLREKVAAKNIRPDIDNGTQPSRWSGIRMDSSRLLRTP